MNYPSWRYGPNGQTVIVMDEDEDDMLGDEWSDVPEEGAVATKDPTYRHVSHVPKSIDVEQIAADVVNAPKRRGRPPKA